MSQNMQGLPVPVEHPSPITIERSITYTWLQTLLSESTPSSSSRRKRDTPHIHSGVKEMHLTYTPRMNVILSAAAAR